MAIDQVFVGCKMPAGVILNLRRSSVDRTGGQIVVTIDGEDLPEVRLKGTARKAGLAPIDIDGYVFTPVAKDFWDAWIERNAGSSLIKDGFIKAAKSLDEGKRMAREHEAAPGMYAPIVPKTKDNPKGVDPANKFRSQNEIASRAGGLDVKTFDKDD